MDRNAIFGWRLVGCSQSPCGLFHGLPPFCQCAPRGLSATVDCIAPPRRRCRKGCGATGQTHQPHAPRATAGATGPAIRNGRYLDDHGDQRGQRHGQQKPANPCGSVRPARRPCQAVRPSSDHRAPPPRGTADQRVPAGGAAPGFRQACRAARRRWCGPGRWRRTGRACHHGVRSPCAAGRTADFPEIHSGISASRYRRWCGCRRCRTRHRRAAGTGCHAARWPPNREACRAPVRAAP